MKRLLLLAAMLSLLTVLPVEGIGRTSGAHGASAGLFLPFTPESGSWRVISGYNNGSTHTSGNRYGLDFQRVDSPQGGQPIVAIGSGVVVGAAFECRIYDSGGDTKDSSGNWYHKAGKGIHVRLDVETGSISKYYYAQYCHLDEWSTPSVGLRVTGGYAFADNYADAHGVSHVHLSLFKGRPSVTSDIDSTPSNSGRTGVAFTGDFKLGGVDFPKTTDRNAYSCWYDTVDPRCDVQAGVPTPVASKIIDPKPKSRLAGSTVTFKWDDGQQVSARYLFVGTKKGQNDVFNNWVSGNSQVVSNIPTNGKTVWVQMRSLLPTGWVMVDFSFKAAKAPPAVVRLCDEPNYGGECRDFGEGYVADFTTIGFDNKASSIKLLRSLGECGIVKVWNNPYAGQPGGQIFPGYADFANLQDWAWGSSAGPSLNNSISSLYVSLSEGCVSATSEGVTVTGASELPASAVTPSAGASESGQQGFESAR
ncbi:MAG: hypothetical protein ACKVVT_13065 [Dehalococcoidia bacterium]